MSTFGFVEMYSLNKIVMTYVLQIKSLDIVNQWGVIPQHSQVCLFTSMINRDSNVNLPHLYFHT